MSGTSSEDQRSLGSLTRSTAERGPPRHRARFAEPPLEKTCSSGDGSERVELGLPVNQ